LADADADDADDPVDDDVTHPYEKSTDADDSRTNVKNKAERVLCFILILILVLYYDKVYSIAIQVYNNIM